MLADRLQPADSDARKKTTSHGKERVDGSSVRGLCKKPQKSRLSLSKELHKLQCAVVRSPLILQWSPVIFG